MSCSKSARRCSKSSKPIEIRSSNGEMALSHFRRHSTRLSLPTRIISTESNCLSTFWLVGFLLFLSGIAVSQNLKPHRVTLIKHLRLIHLKPPYLTTAKRLHLPMRSHYETALGPWVTLWPPLLWIIPKQNSLQNRTFVWKPLHEHLPRRDAVLHESSQTAPCQQRWKM